MVIIINRQRIDTRVHPQRLAHSNSILLRHLQIVHLVAISVDLFVNLLTYIVSINVVIGQLSISLWHSVNIDLELLFATASIHLEAFFLQFVKIFKLLFGLRQFAGPADH